MLTYLLSIYHDMCSYFASGKIFILPFLSGHCCGGGKNLAPQVNDADDCLLVQIVQVNRVDLEKLSTSS